MLSRHGSSAVIKFNHDSNEVVVLSKDERATPGGLGLPIESTTIPMLMATTTSITITAVWSE